MFGYQVLRLQWVIPWTSTLSAFLIVAALFLLDRFDLMRSHNPTTSALGFNAFLFGLAAGALVPTRPADISAVAPAALVYAVLVLSIIVRRPEQRVQASVSAAAGMAGAAIPLCLFLAFNLLSVGSPGGRYFDTVVGTIGFDLAQIPERAFSLFIASQVYYLEFDADWLSVIPVGLMAIIVAIASAFFGGPLAIRVAGVMMVTQCLIYASYRDLLPMGMFRFFNIHYFKWMFPVAFSIVAYRIGCIFSEDRLQKRAGWATMVLSAGILLLASCITVTRHDGDIVSATASAQRVNIRLAQMYEIQIVDLEGIKTALDNAALTLKSSAVINGNTLRPITDFRVVANDHALRLVIFTPQLARDIELGLPEMVEIPRGGWTPHVFSSVGRLACRFGSNGLTRRALLLDSAHMGYGLCSFWLGCITLSITAIPGNRRIPRI